MSHTILALETSTEACSASLLYQNQLLERYQLAPRQHTALLLPMLQELLQEAGLNLTQMDALAFGCGPGSFTGLRVAASVIQGMAFAHDLPVLPISTLQTLAQGCYREHQATHVLPALDAAMQEIYWGEYHLKGEIMVAAMQETTQKPHAVCAPQQGMWYGVGNGWDKYYAVLEKQIGEHLQCWIPACYPKANDVAILAMSVFQQNKAVKAELALPVYLREMNKK